MPRAIKKKLPMRVMIGVTGASGSIYASRVLELLSERIERVYLVVTESGEKVARHELTSDEMLRRILEKKMTSREKLVIRYFACDDLFAPCASGTAVPDAVVILPCSMGTLSRITVGNSGNLLERAADVALKQKRKLIICPRETPLNLIHLRNMVSLVEAGADMVPLMPGFYQKPQSVDDIVNFCTGKILEQLSLTHDLYRPWNSRMM
jgi:4-hydroxy-3-polyprenylbenzoate decarboxylase